MLPAKSIFLLLELLAVSYFDFKTRKISNIWPLTNIFFFSVCLCLWPQWYDSFQWPLIFLGAGYVLFLFKIMGAGDVKLLATFFLLIPVSLRPDLAWKLLYSTIIVGGSLLLLKGIKNFDKIFLAYIFRDASYLGALWGKKFVYAPVVLMAYTWFMIESYL